MIIKEYVREEGDEVSRIHRHTYKFARDASAPGLFADVREEKSLLSGHITKGDAVTVSIEPDLLALARGFILELDPLHVVVGVDHELNISGLMARTRRARNPSFDAAQTIFRIDKDELSGGMSRIRDNLAQLFYVKGDTRRLALIVDLVPPVFDASLAPPPETLPSVLNASQKEAMRKVLSAKDYSLILGMPGTGKTTTTAEIIKTLVSHGKSVLLTSYTHSAVDAILVKLLDSDLEVLRLGNSDRVRDVFLIKTWCSCCVYQDTPCCS